MMTAHCLLRGERELSVVYEIKNAVIVGESLVKRGACYTARRVDLTLPSGQIYSVTNGLVSIANANGVTIERYSVDDRVAEPA